jgi:hypothetical protein
VFIWLAEIADVGHVLARANPLEPVQRLDPLAEAARVAGEPFDPRKRDGKGPFHLGSRSLHCAASLPLLQALGQPVNFRAQAADTEERTLRTLGELSG